MWHNEMKDVLKKIKSVDKDDNAKLIELINGLSQNEIVNLINAVDQVSNILEPIEKTIDDATPGKWYVRGKRVYDSNRFRYVIASTVEGFRHQNVRELDAQYIASVNPESMRNLMSAVGMNGEGN